MKSAFIFLLGLLAGAVISGTVDFTFRFDPEAEAVAQPVTAAWMVNNVLDTKPTATPENVGSYYFDTTAGAVEVSDGATWIPLVAPVKGYKPIELKDIVGELMEEQGVTSVVLNLEKPHGLVMRRLSDDSDFVTVELRDWVGDLKPMTSAEMEEMFEASLRRETEVAWWGPEIAYSATDFPLGEAFTWN